MQEFNKILIRARKELMKSTSPKYKRVLRAQKCFQGLSIDEMTNDARNKLENIFVKLNEIMGRYDLKTFQDYKKIADPDLDKMIDLHLKLYQEFL